MPYCAVKSGGEVNSENAFSDSAQTASQGLPGETRAEVKRRPTPGMSSSDVLSAFFAQQILAGKKLNPGKGAKERAERVSRVARRVSANDYHIATCGSFVSAALREKSLPVMRAIAKFKQLARFSVFW